MPINASYEYLNAEKEYLNAISIEDKIYWLEEMIRKAPKHKGSEHLLAELKTRLRKFKEKAEKAAKKSGGRKGIKKEGFQFVLVGKANSGKSSLIARLTHAQPLVTYYGFSTKKPEIGTYDFEGAKAQVVDLPSIGSEYFDIGIVHTTDCLLLTLENFEQFEEVEKVISRARGKKIYVFTKSDLLDEILLRKLNDRIKSKKINGVVVSALNGAGIEDLKKKMFKEMDVIRVYFKEPGKSRSEIPAVLKNGAIVRDVAETIYKGFSAKVTETRLTGPSGKFPNQKVGLQHVVQDLDTVEFHTR